MRNEDLLKPRYKVIADYPYSEFKIGGIICFERLGVLPWSMEENPVDEWLTDFIESKKGSVMYSERLFSPYPHLFKKLEWWEERKPEDFNDLLYVKVIEDGPVICVVGNTSTHEFIDGSYFGVRHKSGAGIFCTSLLPATKQEYHEFMKPKTNLDPYSPNSRWVQP